MSSAVFTEEYINEIIDQVASNLMLTKWTRDEKAFECIGQNYFGVIMPVSLTSEDKSSTHQIVLKLAPTDERYRVSGAVTIMFHREIFVYSKLLRKYHELNEKITDSKLEFLSPRLYYARDEHWKEVIAMRDMREAGFKPYTHKPFLDLDHVTIALESLAHFHALSFFLKSHDGQLYDQVSDVSVPMTESSNKRYMDIMVDRLSKALFKFEGTSYEPLFLQLRQNCGKSFNNAFIKAKDTCICHGDIWKENILFKYENNRPLQACIIDYQTTRISSPAFDALYLIISSTDAELRHKHYYYLLDVYYKSFQKILKAFNLDADKVYSREFLNHDLKVVAPACFITANTALWLANGLQEEGHVRSKVILNTPEEKSKAVETYKSVVRGIIDDFYSYEYLSGNVL